MCKLFGILLHRFVSSSYLLIYLIVFISLQTHGYLFYNFGLLSNSALLLLPTLFQLWPLGVLLVGSNVSFIPINMCVWGGAVCAGCEGQFLFILITFLSGTSGNFQAHLVYFLPQSQSQPFFSGAVASILGEWCQKSEGEDVLIVWGIVCFRPSQMTEQRNIYVYICIH